MRVRPAEPGDLPGIRELYLAAFPTPAEADLAETLWREGDAVITLVMAQDDAIIGHVLLSRMAVSGDGRSYRALALAPVAVLPGSQGAGIGAGLIEQALMVARVLGEELVFVLGEPDYYRGFGFSAEAAAPFASPYAGAYFMALALQPGLTLPAAGQAAYARAFSAL